jgi:hypothetical protein
MKVAYQKSRCKDIAPFTIINLTSEKEIQMKKWEELLDKDMTLFCDSFEQTLLWRNPRVSIETLFDAILQQHPRETEKSFKLFENLEELQDFVKTINEFELYF